MAQGWGDVSLVTPEAVALEFPTATVGSRTVAYVIDALVVTVVVLLVNLGAFAAFGTTGSATPDWVFLSVVVVLNLLVAFGYPIAAETLWRGRTLGKAAMGLRVVTVEGAPVGFRHAAIRAALQLVDFTLTFGAGAVITALVTRRSQRLGDLAAGTLVVRERSGARPFEVASFTVPPAAAAYAATLDPSGLRPDDYAAVRTFLLRADTLPPGPRADIAGRLAGALGPRVGDHRPPDVDDELFLRCLAARYQQRGAPTSAVPPGGQYAPPRGDLTPPS